MSKKAIIAEILIWSVILAIIFTLSIFAYSKFFVEPNIYNIEFKDIDGITKGSPVRFMGIDVGYVRSLKSKGKHIDIKILITKRNMLIPNGTVARVAFYGLGGSKSIELMPPDGSCDVGILTGNTIRLIDMVHSAQELFEIVDMLEKYTKGLNKNVIYQAIENISNIKGEKIKQIGVDFSSWNSEMNNKFENLRKKQKDMTQKIDLSGQIVNKFNNFLKK